MLNLVFAKKYMGMVSERGAKFTFGRCNCQAVRHGGARYFVYFGTTQDI